MTAVLEQRGTEERTRHWLLMLNPWPVKHLAWNPTRFHKSVHLLCAGLKMPGGTSRRMRTEPPGDEVMSSPFGGGGDKFSQWKEEGWTIWPSHHTMLLRLREPLRALNESSCCWCLNPPLWSGPGFLHHLTWISSLSSSSCPFPPLTHSWYQFTDLYTDWAPMLSKTLWECCLPRVSSSTGRSESHDLSTFQRYWSKADIFVDSLVEVRDEHSSHWHRQILVIRPTKHYRTLFSHQTLIYVNKNELIQPVKGIQWN